MGRKGCIFPEFFDENLLTRMPDGVMMVVRNKHNERVSSMIYRAYMTGERYTTESLEHGDAAERGWVDPNWSMTELQGARNYVRPAAEYNPSDPDDVEQWPTVAAWIADTVAEYLGAAEDNGDGTWYGTDEQTHDFTTDDTYTYALHFHVKHHTSSRGWVEDDVTADGSAS